MVSRVQYPEIHPSEYLKAFPQVSRETLARELGVEKNTIDKYCAQSDRSRRNPGAPVRRWTAKLALDRIKSGQLPVIPLENLHVV
jgi:hypothetical protein